MNHWVHFTFAGLLAIGSVSAKPSAQGDLRGRTPKNILRAHLGVTGGTGPSCPLLKDDPTIPLYLARGEFAIDFILNDLHILSELVFANEESRGDIKCEVSTNGETWVEVVNAHMIPDSRTSRVRFVGSEARFVRLKFSVTEPGNLYCLGLFGLTVAADYDMNGSFATDAVEVRAALELNPELLKIREPLSEEFDQVSLTITPSDASVPWVSSLDQPDPAETEALELIDENSFTVCEFAPDDPSPSVLLDLHEIPMIERVGVLYARQPGVLRLRLLQREDQQSIHLDNENQSPPKGDSGVEEFIFEDFEGVGKFAFDRLATKSRFVELIWEPDVQAATTTKPKQAFSINEVAVFSRGDRKSVEQAPLQPLVKKRTYRTVVQSLRTASPEPEIPVSLANIAIAPASASAAADEVEAPPGTDVDLDLDPTSF
ncbi:MAG: hypothetical protein ACI9R3_000247 [Verrucomicrobiales bacterium]|jgi:hypothetical protein